MQMSIVDPSTLVGVFSELDIFNHLWEPKGPAVGGDRCRIKVFTLERRQ